MMPEIIISVCSLMGLCYSALVNLLSKLFGYFRIWFMYHWTTSSPRKSLRPYLYKIDLYVWQIIFGTPDTGQVVLFDSWLNEPPVECDDCRLKRVGELIDQAKICLDVVLLSTANIQYLKRVLAAHNRGVNVRILASEKMLAAKGPAMQLICALGVPVHGFPDGVKFDYNFAIIDSEKRALALEATKDAVHTCLWRLRLKGWVR